jgi:hypothetical protein
MVQVPVVTHQEIKTNNQTNETQSNHVAYMNAAIKQISTVGKMKIEFNDVLFDKVNVSMLNKTHIEMYIKPAANRETLAGFKLSQVNFTWKCVKAKNNSMDFNLTFESPLEVSPLIEQDQLIFFVRDEGYPLFKSKNGRYLAPESRLLTKKVP